MEFCYVNIHVVSIGNAPFLGIYCMISKGQYVHIKRASRRRIYIIAKAAELPQKSLKTLAALAISRLDNQAI